MQPISPEPAPPDLTFRAVDEGRPGPKLRALFEQRSDAYLAWYLQDGDVARPTLEVGIAALRLHMPELVEVHAELTREVAAGDPTASRMFTLLRPPASAIACSQGVWSDGEDGPILVRNYDYPAGLIDGVILRSKFLDRVVVGTTDTLWGLTDGMNDRGLAVSLTFGGRAVVGEGFGISLVVRYLLETCETVSEAKDVLARLPFAQAHNLTITDATGAVVTAYLGPDRVPSYRRLPVATNHQWVVESWDPALAASSLEREWWLLRLLDDPEVDAKGFADWFLAPPLYSYGHAEGVGTVFTASYDVTKGTLAHRWPGLDWVQGLDDFEEGERAVTFPPALVAI